MIPELGLLALILALCLSVLLALVPLWGTWSGNAFWMRFAVPLVNGQFVFIALSFACLVWAFVTDDFSVAYVASNSNSQLPWYYKFSAVWGGHEGSMLLWVLILSGWTFAVAWRSQHLPLDIQARVLAIMGLISVGFLLFMLLTSSPFARLLPNVPADGRDLNPLLQDIGLIMHPPMLYMGYVGFSVAFAFAIAALLSGRVDAAWVRWTRPWTNAAWTFLTIGIALGSWWAYYELGWGGWWFWDPVENASFMPWLVGTALLHSLAVTEKRGEFKSWTVLLAILAFSLSLLGTFLVRSGVLTSVHAFASDPSRGYFILMLLAITVGGSFLLYAWRGASLSSQASFELFSRETMLLLNNLLLLVMTVVVLLGTLYPLVSDALELGKLSVGPPYFNLLFVPLTAILSVLLGAGIAVRWKRHLGSQWRRQLLWPLLITLLGGTLCLLLEQEVWLSALGTLMALWIVANTLLEMGKRIAVTRWRQSGGFWGMHLAHLGLAVTIMGVTWVSLHAQEQDMRMQAGDKVAVLGFDIKFIGTHHFEGPNFISDRGHFQIYRDGKRIAELYPEKRKYLVQNTVMTEAAIRPSLFEDIYIALGEPLEDGAWAVRVHIKPLVRWIWLGGLLMGIGGLIAAMDRRYALARQRQRRDAAETVEAGQHA
ncbi:heme lyase CcmF/NrfE family subunit [Balneatrix alpica]|uniref:Heme lyase CcmF/NrfE family subunit n=1 Tax=Balneatrix alpica TaxID=75684 RepID=A0ABV5ZE10_9GAMM|nr:heme lyase CcmF/NrfE family subunit [Balneatrix alpica]